MESSKKSKLHLTVFDLDHTLLTINCSFKFGAYLYRQKAYSFGKLLLCLMDYGRHKWFGMSIYDLHHRIFARLFKGRSHAFIQSQVHSFLSQYLKTMIYPPAFKRLSEAKRGGDYVLILSSSPDFLVKEIAHQFGGVNWKATDYQANKEEELIAVSRVMEGKDKADYLKELMATIQVSQSDMTVYSDSYLDLPMLKMAGKAIGVRPDSRLKSICIKSGWEIL